MKKKSTLIVFISLLFILCGCGKKDPFCNLPKTYSSYLNKSLGKWKVISVTDEDGYSMEHSTKTRTWIIKNENGVELNLHDTYICLFGNLTKTSNDVAFTRQLLTNIDTKYRSNIISDIKKVNKDILDVSFFYENDVDDLEENSEEHKKSYAKKVLKDFIIKDMTPEKFYKDWCKRIEISIELADKDFDKNE